MSEELAVDGGRKVRTKPFPPWPHFFEDEMQEVQKVLEEGNRRMLKDQTLSVKA